MIALTVLESWAVIGLSAGALILLYLVLDLSLSAFSQWWNDAAPGQGEDSSANQERER